MTILTISKKALIFGLLATILLASFLVSPGLANAATNRDPADKVARLFDNLNKFRADKKLPAVKYNANIAKVPSDWTATMADRQDLSHNPKYASDSRIPSGWRLAGEIIAYNWNSDMDSMFNLWVNSAPHNAIMSNGQYTTVGIGIADAKNGSTYATIDFYRYEKEPAGSVASLTPLTVSKNLSGANNVSILGNPTGKETKVTGPDGAYQNFQNGKIYWSSKTGAHRVINDNGAKKIGQTAGMLPNFQRVGWEKKVGFPTNEQYKFSARPTVSGQQFEKALLVNLSSTKYSSIRGGIQSKWKSMGWEKGALQMPNAGDEKCGLVRGGCYQSFEKGNMYWSPASSTHPVANGFFTAWKKQGYEKGKLGYPTSDEFKSGSQTRQNFEKGYMTWTSKGAVTTLKK